MIKQHTAQSLARYLGREVQVKFGNTGGQSNLGKLHSIGIRGEGFIKGAITSMYSHFKLEEYQGFDKHENYKPDIIHPLLKDYTQLTKEDIETVYTSEREIEGYEIEVYKSFDYLEFSDEDGVYVKYRLHPIQIEKLKDLGYGAIKDRESPTKYVDLWGDPCALKEKK